MKIYTYSEARQRLAALLEKARRQGSVQIRRRDGQVFEVRPQAASDSPLDVGGVNLDVTRREIVELIREGRRRDS